MLDVCSDYNYIALYYWGEKQGTLMGDSVESMMPDVRFMSTRVKKGEIR